MATANIRAVITAEDNASKVVQSFGNNVGKSNDRIVKSNQSTATSFNQVLVATAGAGIAANRLVDVISDTVTAANKEQAALTGLASITRAFSQDTDKAMKAAQSLAKDGLLTVGDAALGLKNLLAAGFNLDQATKLMERFKDSAAFGKQSALSFGQAVTSATEGIKNGNSILVDNAGVTKNLSIILEEAGFSAQDLMRATTDANVRMAIFNGIVKETNPQVGDAAKLTELFAGKQAQLSAKTIELKARIGEALQPALTKMLETIAPLVEKFAKFATDHPQVVAAFLLITTAGLGLIAVLGSIGLAVMGLGPVFAAFSVTSHAAITGVSVAFKGMSALIATPLVMPAIAVVAALIAIKQVHDAARELHRELDATQNAAVSTGNNIDSYFKSLRKARDEGRIDQTEFLRRSKAYSNSIQAPARASGGMVSGSQPYMVGERGPELFVPNQAGTIRKNSGSGGGSVSINVNVGMYAGSELEKRKIAVSLLESMKDVASAKNMTLQEMF